MQDRALSQAGAQSARKSGKEMGVNEQGSGQVIRNLLGHAEQRAETEAQKVPAELRKNFTVQ